MIHDFLVQLQHNELLIGLAGTSILISLLYTIRRLPIQIFDAFKWFFTVTITIRNDENIYTYVNDWCANLSYAKKARRMSLTATYCDDICDYRWTSSVGPGGHIVRYGLSWIYIYREIGEAKAVGNGSKVSESLTIRTLGRSQATIKSIIAEAMVLSRGSQQLNLYNWDDYWTKMKGRDLRSIDTVILEGGQQERLLADIKWFLSAKSWYTDRGISYKRGYLLSGPAGTGKTSIVASIASHFKMPVYILNLSTVDGDNALMRAFSYAPPSSIILLEDIDAMGCTNARKDKPKGKSKDTLEIDSGHDAVTLSGVLNALDGIVAATGSLIFMTTNHPDKLDEALIRPGRVDMHERVGYLETNEIERLHAIFYPSGNARLFAQEFTEPQSPAYLISLFMKEPHDEDKLLALTKS